MCSGCVNQPKETNQLSIVSFNVEPNTVDRGESANLSWIVSGANSVSIDNGIGDVTLSGHQIVFPTQNTTYILTASNSNNTIQATAHVYVTTTSEGGTQLTPLVSMIASPVIRVGICSIMIATTSSPYISWATDVIVTLNCITNATRMPAVDITVPTSGYITSDDLITCTNLSTIDQFSLTLTYRATNGLMGTVTWTQS